MGVLSQSRDDTKVMAGDRKKYLVGVGGKDLHEFQTKDLYKTQLINFVAYTLHLELNRKKRQQEFRGKYSFEKNLVSSVHIIHIISRGSNQECI